MAQTRNRLRIIGGRYRGRRLAFPDQPGLRPTSDRVRETLFNWLAPVIAGARCLDVFAGSGALGFEAASRGAAEVVMLERASPVARQLEANARMLDAARISIHRVDALQWLSSPGEPFDLIFVDPPFADGLLSPTIERLHDNGWVAPGTRIYLEAPIQVGLPALPSGWELIRDKTAGRTCYGLVSVIAEDSSHACGT